MKDIVRYKSTHTEGGCLKAQDDGDFVSYASHLCRIDELQGLLFDAESEKARISNNYLTLEANFLHWKNDYSAQEAEGLKSRMKIVDLTNERDNLYLEIENLERSLKIALYEREQYKARLGSLEAIHNQNG